MHLLFDLVNYLLHQMDLHLDLDLGLELYLRELVLLATVCYHDYLCLPLVID